MASESRQESGMPRVTVGRLGQSLWLRAVSRLLVASLVAGSVPAPVGASLPPAGPFQPWAREAALEAPSRPVVEAESVQAAQTRAPRPLRLALLGHPASAPGLESLLSSLEPEAQTEPFEPQSEEPGTSTAPESEAPAGEPDAAAPQPDSSRSYTFPAGFSLVSVPLAPANSNPAAVFGGLPAPQRVYDYVGGQTLGLGETGFRSVAPGRVYWLLLDAPATVNVQGNPVTTGSEFRVSLAGGWNGVATPWLTEVEWADTRVSVRRGTSVLPLSEALTQGWIEALRSFASGSGSYVALSANAGTALEPWQGYALYAPQAAELIFSAPPADTQAPVAEITSPAEGGHVTEPTDVVGTADDPNLQDWRLEWRRMGSGTWVTLATGDGPVVDGVLGQVDPTRVKNGLHELRLVVRDTGGLTGVATRRVVVRGQQKIGHFSVSFVDVDVPVGGLPIRVGRTYDSRDTSRGDFGHGWRLDLATTELQESETAYVGWQTQGSGTFPPTVCVVDTAPHYLTLTMPDGQVLEFDMRLTPQCEPFAYTVGNVVYQARPGTLGTLLPVGPTDVTVEGGALMVSGSFELYDPQEYEYTTPEGRVFRLHRQNGLEQVKDPHGNELLIGPTGVLHNSGRSVAFVRDGLGRITKVTDPDGHFLSYAYDPDGDLQSVTDREGAVTTFGYSTSFAHYLEKIVDPKGQQPIRNDYYPDGRLQRHTDAYGKTIEYTHELSSRQELVKDREGRWRVLEYDARGNVVKDVDGEGQQVLRTFDGRDNRLSETEAHAPGTSNPPRTEYTYDTQDNLTLVRDAVGNETAYTYDTGRRVLTTTDARGNVTTNVYDARGNLLTTTDALGNVSEQTYDARGNLLTQKTTTAEGLVAQSSSTYDLYGNVLTETDPSGHVTSYTYDQSGRRKTQTTTRSLPGGGTQTLQTGWQYDKAGRVTKQTDPDGSYTRTVYDGTGRAVESWDKLNRKTAHEHDAMGRLVKTTYPDLTWEQSGYDGEGRRTSFRDRGGRTTRYAYDGTGKLLKTTYPDGSFTSNVYDAAGRLSQTIDARGQATSYEYDQAGRRKKVTDALSQATEFFYDEAGNQTAVKDARGHVTSYEYDELNRRTKVTYPDLSFSTTGYDGLGRRTSETDQAGKVTRFQYDLLGRLTKVTDALLGETVYGYDELGNRTSQTDANGHTTGFEYDALGRETARILPDGSRETKAYDAAGSLRTRTDFLGRTTSYGYDLSNRLVSTTYPDTSVVSYSYTPTGRRQTVTDGRGTTSYGYDSRDRLVSLSQPGVGTLGYGFDAAGNRTSMTATVAGNSYSTGYGYDVLGRLEAVTDPLSRVYGYGYDGNGNRASLSQPNGTATSYGYDSLNRLTSLQTSSPSGVVQGYGFTLGPAGNRTRIDEAGGTSRSYTYDDLYRLTGESVTGGLAYGKTFTYDAVGNRQTQATTTALPSPPPPLAPATVNYGYDTRDRLLSEAALTYSYDLNGNLTGKSGEATYTWDFDDRLVRVQKTDGTVVEHIYDADGNRVQTTTTLPGQPAKVTSYLVDTSGGLSHVVAEVDGSTGLQALYVRGMDDLLAVMRPDGSGGWQSRFYHADGIGSVRRLTDEAGNTTDSYTYSAFGELLEHVGTDPQPYAFTGEPYDPNVGFQYHRGRWMDPRVGRFLGMDPFGGSAFDPPTLHGYQYAAGSPVDGIDPSGQFTQATGYAVEAALRPFYEASHPGDDVIFGRWARVGYWPSLKPDIFNRTKRTFLEIKPFSLSGILAGPAQLLIYELFFAHAGYRPEYEWIPPRLLTLSSGPVPVVAVVNIGGVLYYTDLLDNLEDILLIKSLESTAQMIRILRGARAAVSIGSEFAAVGRLASVATVSGNSRSIGAVANAIMLTVLAGFAF